MLLLPLFHALMEGLLPVSVRGLINRLQAWDKMKSDVYFRGYKFVKAWNIESGSLSTFFPTTISTNLYQIWHLAKFYVSVPYCGIWGDAGRNGIDVILGMKLNKVWIYVGHHSWQNPFLFSFSCITCKQYFLHYC